MTIKKQKFTKTCGVYNGAEDDDQIELRTYRSRDVADGYSHQLCQAETPQESQTSDLENTSQQRGDCKAIISGLLCGKPMQWEVTFDIEPFLNGREREEKVHEELWNETFHHLAGCSIIQDFEHMAERECEIEHGEQQQDLFVCAGISLRSSYR